MFVFLIVVSLMFSSFNLQRCMFRDFSRDLFHRYVVACPFKDMGLVSMSVISFFVFCYHFLLLGKAC